MGQEATGSREKDQTQIMDEVGISATQSRIVQLRSEVDTFTETLTNIELVLKENPERFETHMAIMKLQAADNNHKPINPTKRYETLPEYLELVTKTLEYKIIDEQRKYDENFKRTKQQADAVKEQLKSSQDQLDKELSKLKEAGVSF